MERRNKKSKICYSCIRCLCYFVICLDSPFFNKVIYNNIFLHATCSVFFYGIKFLISFIGSLVKTLSKQILEHMYNVKYINISNPKITPISINVIYFCIYLFSEYKMSFWHRGMVEEDEETEASDHLRKVGE